MRNNYINSRAQDIYTIIKCVSYGLPYVTQSSKGSVTTTHGSDDMLYLLEHIVDAMLGQKEVYIDPSYSWDWPEVMTLTEDLVLWGQKYIGGPWRKTISFTGNYSRYVMPNPLNRNEKPPKDLPSGNKREIRL